MAPPLIVRAVLDATGYLKVSESVVSSNTLMAESALGMGASFTKSAEAQIAAGAKVITSQRAQLTQLKMLQAQAIAGSDRRIAADVAVAKAERALALSTGGVAIATRGASAEAKVAERDIGKLTRGALAGSGVFAALGRSLAFASTGFIAVAGGSTLIAESIRQAEELDAAQRRVDQQLKVSGKSWDQYGAKIDAVLLKQGHLAGFTRSQLLQAFTYLLRVGGNVRRSLDLTSLATDVARGRSISLQAASIALAKALGGSVTALRRLGIVVPNNVTKMKALEYVQRKFAGQADAGTKSSDRFLSSLADAGATIGTVLLPTFERLLRKGGDWIHRMNESGKLTKDVTAVTHSLGTGFHLLEGAISTVDRVTGGFGKTLVLLGEIWVGIKITGWITSLNRLAATWGLVGSAATKAAVAEAAASGGAAAGAGARAGGGGGLGALLTGGLIGRLLGRGPTAVAGRVGMYTGAGAAAGTAASATGVGALAVASIIAAQALNDFAVNLSGGSGSVGGKISDAITGFFTGGLSGNAKFSPFHAIFGQIFHGRAPFASALQSTFGTPPPAASGSPAFLTREPRWLSRLEHLLGLPASPFYSRPGQQAQQIGGTRIREIKDFQLTMTEQLLQAQAGLTRSTADDAAAAKRVIARIKTAIDHGRLHGKALIDALNAEANALGTLWAIEDTAAQKRAAAAEAATARASTYDIPGTLQLAQAKAEAYGKNETAILKKIIAAAEHAIAAGGKNWKGLVAAYGVIASARQQLEQDAQGAIIPLRMQLALAKAQATGADQSQILRRMKAALEKALRAAKGNIQRQIDIWNEITSINQQLGSSVTNAYGKYRKASLKWEMEGLGLTPEQRRALEARLSQIGPGGSHPASGTGAAGYIIDPETGRPMRQRRGSRYSSGGADSNTATVNANIDLHVYIDGKQVEATVTNRQQKNNTRRPTQRRGPNAATR